MSKPVVTPNQGVFTWGVDPRNRIMVDSTRSVVATGQELVAGCPIALDGTATAANAGKLKSTATTGDVFYGLTSTNVNDLYGKSSLGEFSGVRANAELQGLYTVRESVFLDANGDEVTINPFEDGVWQGGADFPTGPEDIGTIMHAKLVTSETELGPVTMLKWTPGGASTGAGFRNVGMIVDIRDTEVDIMLPNVMTAYDSDLSS